MSFVTIESSTARKIASLLLSIEAIKLNHKNPFTWSSGWKSPVYCDNRLALSYPEIRTFVKESLASAIKRNFPSAQYVAGVATAGIPQGALVADALGLPFVYVRPKPKEHGMGNLIEGKIDAGKKVIMIEDLISTGGSSLKAAQAMQEAGFEVIGMMAIFTYGFDVAVKAFEQAQIPLVCLSDFNYLLTEAVDKKYLDESQLSYVQSWRANPSQWK
jgi:orotate phosphoribosyltransferase